MAEEMQTSSTKLFYEITNPAEKFFWALDLIIEHAENAKHMKNKEPEEYEKLYETAIHIVVAMCGITELPHAYLPEDKPTEQEPFDEWLLCIDEILRHRCGGGEGIINIKDEIERNQLGNYKLPDLRAEYEKGTDASKLATRIAIETEKDDV